MDLLGLPLFVLALAALAVAGVLAWAGKQRVPALEVDLEGDAVRLPAKPSGSNIIHCYDPATMETFGYAKAMSADEASLLGLRGRVRASIKECKEASKVWRGSSFAQRRLLLKTLVKYVVENQEAICRISARDSGKPLVDASFGEVLGTCEKIWWLCSEGERYLRPESRSAGYMMFYKKARVEYHPVGVVGAIVPWNYPFHNILNPLTAALFAGNGAVIKVSEHATWSALAYERVIDAALAAVGAPKGLVRIVTGYGEAGNALVTGGVDKLIFVGSTAIGHKVLEAAATTLTPVVLELGGKDAFVILEDADLATVTATALRGAFQSCGQNCAGAERFIVHRSLADRLLERAVGVVRRMRQGPAAGPEVVDCGSMCMPGQAEKVQALVDDAVAKGAKVLVGGKLPDQSKGLFYPPTVITGVTRGMRIWEEEVFGPVMTVIPFDTEDEAIALANDCPFGLGSAVFSRSAARARRVGAQLEAGMTSINDFATTYMCQSLPFGGVKESGFDRFAGVEGLRGLCVPKAVAEDRWPFSTAIPPLLQYPVSDKAFEFCQALVCMFYAPDLSGNFRGLLRLAACFVPLPGFVTGRAKKTA